MKRLALGFGSAMGAAAVSYSLGIPAAWVVLAIFILGSHEISHLLSARASGADGYIFFVPLGVFVLGVTRLLSLPRSSRGLVAQAGGLAGISAVLTTLPLTLLWGLGWISLLLFATEVYSVLFGKDSKLRTE